MKDRDLNEVYLEDEEENEEEEYCDEAERVGMYKTQWGWM